MGCQEVRLICKKFVTLPQLLDLFIVLDENKSGLADTLSVLLTAKTSKLPEAKNLLAQ